jgi:Arc/MetJ-type ribon-helix-helix transcriptional regulator
VTASQYDQPASRYVSFAVTTPLTRGGILQNMTEYTTVSIPKDLADRVEDTIEGTSFSNTSDLVRFLLRSIVIQHQREGALTEAEFQDIADQLQDLGYLE